MDRISKLARSKNMAAVRSRGNVSTELALARIFRKEGITGWRRNRGIFGIRPDFVFLSKNLAIFVDGCFWHGCTKCRTIPKQNRAFWKKKIEGNRKRDKKVMPELRRRGWKVVRLWEHDLKREGKILDRLRRFGIPVK